MKYLTREELNEQSIIHIAIMSNLIRDAENIIEYLTYIRQGVNIHAEIQCQYIA